MQIPLLVALIVLVAVVLVVQVLILRRSAQGTSADSSETLEQIKQAVSQLPTNATMRDESAAMRKELADTAKAQREEQAQQSKAQREELSKKFDAFGISVANNIDSLGRHQRDRLKDFSEQLAKLTKASEEKADALRKAVEGKLEQLQLSNEQKLEKMRQTVDEKLHKTLETRLGESFKQVSERLEKVHQGLGEMQELAGGVSDLKRVMTNVKTRGTWGEVQLGSLLEQMLTPEQYETNCKVRPRSDVQVEYAIKMPGPDNDEGRGHIYLPIDAKFPLDKYEQLLQALDGANIDQIEQSRKELEAAVLKEARSIREKYIAPPYTTDFAILFVPTEGLYAELLRRPGLADRLQRECRVNLAGPTTLAALLNSLQMGFRTLAIQKKSSDVWKTLGGVKAEFGKFTNILAGVKKKLQEATNKIESAESKSRNIGRKLSKVQELPAAEDPAAPLLDSASDPDPDPDLNSDSDQADDPQPDSEALIEGERA